MSTGRLRAAASGSSTIAKQRGHRRVSSAVEVSAPVLGQRAVMYSAPGGAAEVWRKVNALAARPGMINMGQGFPDFEGSAIARRAAQVALDDAPVNQYSPQPGSDQLRREISAFYGRRYGTTLDPSTEIVVTSSGQEALCASFQALLDPGDEVSFLLTFCPPICV